MELRSGRPYGGADRISALSDDLLLLILARLGCAAAAARAGLLSRRWRGLWTGLPALVFRDVGVPSLDPALASAAAASPNAVVSLLDIRLPERAFFGEGRRDVSSLLRTAARLSPDQLVLALPWAAAWLYSSVELPCFARATSISISADYPIILRPPSGDLPALTTLLLTGCAIDGLAALVLRCPGLRVLRFLGPDGSSTTGGNALDITVQSASLRELVLQEGTRRARRIDIATPMLEDLAVFTSPSRNYLGFSVLAPKLEKVSWRRRYGGRSLGFGCWTLQEMSLLSTMTAAMAAAQRRRSSVLLRIDVSKVLDFLSQSVVIQAYMAQEVEKLVQLQVAADSSLLALELHPAPLGHVYEALVFYFLEMHLIRTAIHRLKVILPQPETTYKDKRECAEYCGCVPRHWTRQTIFLAELEEVEIDGFQGAKHEFDFLQHLFSCASMLKRVTLKQSSRVAPNDTTVHDFFKAYPYIKCNIYSVV